LRIVDGLRRLRTGIKSRLSNRTLILMYHRVSEAESDPWGLAVTPAHFAEHLEVLRDNFQVAPLSALCGESRRSFFPQRRVVITFDDGYSDNYYNAKPLLERFECPATVFVTTGYTGLNREFWWDELERLCLGSHELPVELKLEVNGSRYEWKQESGVGGQWSGSGGEARNEGSSWRAWDKENQPNSRHTLYREMWQMMHPMRESERLEVRDELLEWTGHSGLARASHRPLDENQINEMSSCGLIEIGCHTVTHPKLATLDLESQRKEIGSSKERLEEILGERVRSFAYPYGRECDYTSDTVGLLREAEFECGCSTSQGLVEDGSARFQLPRLQVPDVDGEAFARLVKEVMSDRVLEK
jgi:peptidoglycan/xylan/chitin deacetylase (PgdA/CDA1 family)